MTRSWPYRGSKARTHQVLDQAVSDGLKPSPPKTLPRGSFTAVIGVHQSGNRFRRRTSVTAGRTGHPAYCSGRTSALRSGLHSHSWSYSVVPESDDSEG